MGVIVVARVLRDDDLYYAPLVPFQGNLLVKGEYPSFRQSEEIALIFRSIGYSFTRCTQYSPMQIVAIYGALLKHSQQQVLENEMTHALLHFLGICLANQYFLSIE